MYIIIFKLMCPYSL